MLQRPYPLYLSERLEELLPRCFFLVIFAIGATCALQAQTDWRVYHFIREFRKKRGRRPRPTWAATADCQAVADEIMGYSSGFGIWVNR